MTHGLGGEEGAVAMRAGDFWRGVAALAAALYAGAAQAEVDRLSAVHISTQCTNPETGAVAPSQGTGVIVSADGVVVTAHHVLACWLDQPAQQRRDTPIQGRVGSSREAPLALDYIASDAIADVAVLRFAGVSREFAAAPLCALRSPEAGTAITAAGFPLGQDYQPVSGQIGNTSAPGGRWAASLALSPGMSGGPVYVDGRVAGLIKGGAQDDNNTVRVITPIYRGAALIEPEAGLRIGDCNMRPQNEEEAVYEPITEGGMIRKSGALVSNQGNAAPSATVTLGDYGYGVGSRAFLSFPLGDVPDGVEILSASLSIEKGGGNGDLNRRYFSRVIIEVVDIGDQLDAGDYDRAGRVVAQVPIEELNQGPVDLTGAVKLAVLQGREVLTLRLRFSVENDNDEEPDIWAISDSRGGTLLKLRLRLP